MWNRLRDLRLLPRSAPLTEPFSASQFIHAFLQETPYGSRCMRRSEWQQFNILILTNRGRSRRPLLFLTRVFHIPVFCAGSQFPPL